MPFGLNADSSPCFRALPARACAKKLPFPLPVSRLFPRRYQTCKKALSLHALCNLLFCPLHIFAAPLLHAPRGLVRRLTSERRHAILQRGHGLVQGRRKGFGCRHLFTKPPLNRCFLKKRGLLQIAIAPFSVFRFSVFYFLSAYFRFPRHRIRRAKR